MYRRWGRTDECKVLLYVDKLFGVPTDQRKGMYTW